eukprot:COSAG01_NODE_3561_length_5931_cov_4.674211_3_plen_110_part_00
MGDSGLLLLLLRSLAKNSLLAATGSTGSCWQRTLPTCRRVFKNFNRICKNQASHSLKVLSSTLRLTWMLIEPRCFHSAPRCTFRKASIIYLSCQILRTAVVFVGIYYTR